MKEVLKYLLDANCFDYLALNHDDFSAILEAKDFNLIELIGTHVEEDELIRTEIAKPEYVSTLLNIRKLLSIRKVPASGFVYEISKLDEASLFGWDEIDEFIEMTNDNPRHAEDILLLRTARKENAVLVTEEKSRLPKLAREKLVEAVNTFELANICRELANSARG